MTNAQIVVVTPGRFHSFDLAEQLQRSGRLTAIYTGYPRFKLRNTAVEPNRIRSYPWFQTPYMGLGRFTWMPQQILDEIAWQAYEQLDAYAARTLPDCALVTALSSSGLRVGAEIKRRGGVYVCDRGSTHIRWQQRILAEEYEALGISWRGIDPRVIAKEAAEYALADAITLPSQFTMRSFVAMGVPAAKLRLVPYGVNLGVFRRCAERATRFRVLFVGQLSVRKGIHYLLQAFARAALPDAELVLVGGKGPDTDALLTRYPVKNLILTGVLPRDEVAREMSRASVFVLPSIEEGLALVQAQALACGCPVIATENAGAEDLFSNGKEGLIVPARSIDALAAALTRLYRAPDLLAAISAAAIARVRAIGGWDQYGRAMLGAFDELLDGGTAGAAQA